jgi:hypothetical protein
MAQQDTGIQFTVQVNGKQVSGVWYAPGAQLDMRRWSVFDVTDCEAKDVQPLKAVITASETGGIDALYNAVMAAPDGESMVGTCLESVVIILQDAPGHNLN